MTRKIKVSPDQVNLFDFGDLQHTFEGQAVAEAPAEMSFGSEFTGGMIHSPWAKSCDCTDCYERDEMWWCVRCWPTPTRNRYTDDPWTSLKATEWMRQDREEHPERYKRKAKPKKKLADQRKIK